MHPYSHVPHLFCMQCLARKFGCHIQFNANASIVSCRCVKRCKTQRRNVYKYVLPCQHCFLASLDTLVMNESCETTLPGQTWLSRMGKNDAGLLQQCVCVRAIPDVLHNLGCHAKANAACQSGVFIGALPIHSLRYMKFEMS